jgi:hypothetical protein
MKRLQFLGGQQLRPPVRWALAITAAASLAALIWPAPAVVGVNEERPSRHGSADEAQSASSVPVIAASPAPRGAPSGAIAALPVVDFDPFVGVPSTPAGAPPPAPASQVAAPPPPPAPPPPNDYRFAGRLIGPDGTHQILLGRGDAIVTISKGMTLDNGYRVESISADAVLLAYPRPEGLVTISLPIPPDALSE